MADDRRRAQLSLAWDEIAAGGAPRVGDGLEAAVADALTWFQAIGEVPVPDAERERSRRAMRRAIERMPEPRRRRAGVGDRLGLTAPGARRERREPRLSLGFVALTIVTIGLLVVYAGTGLHAPATQSGATPTSIAISGVNDRPVGEGGNAARTNAMPGPGPHDAPVLAWEADLSGYTGVGAPFNAVTAGSGLLFVPGSNGIAAIDRQTGRIVWRSTEYTGSPVLDGDGIILRTVSTQNGEGYDLVRIRQADGSLSWRAFDGQIAADAAPVVAGGTGYVTIGDALVAFDATTGKESWRVRLNAPAASWATLAYGDTVVTADQNGTIYWIATRFQQVRGTDPTDATRVDPAVIAGDAVIAAGWNGTRWALYGFDLTGALRWRFIPPNGSSLQPAAVDETTAYVSDANGTLYALDTATGKLGWSRRLGDHLVASPTIAGGVLYLSDFSDNGGSGAVHALDPATGDELWRYDLDAGGNFTPAVIDGVVYAGSADGRLYAIAGSGASTSVPSPRSVPARSATPSGTNRLPMTYEWATTDSPDVELVPQTAAAVAPDGTLWVANVLGYYSIFDQNGTSIGRWGETALAGGGFAFGNGELGVGQIAFAPDGSFYVVQTAIGTVRHYDKERRYLGSFEMRGRGDGQFLLPLGIAIEPDGNVLVSDYLRGDIQRFDPNGRYLGRIDGTGTPDGPLAGPTGIAVDAAGRIFVAEMDAGRVRILDHDGNQIGVLGGTPESDAGLDHPSDVAIAANGNSYVIDRFHDRVVVFDAQGRFLGQFGESGNGDGQFANPIGVALGPGGAIYVVDQGNDRVEKLQLAAPPAVAATPAPPADR